MTTQGHYGTPDIKKKISSLNSAWSRLKELSQLRQQALEDALKAQQYFSDAQEAESWMKEKEPIVSSADFGKDEDSAQVGVTMGCGLVLVIMLFTHTYICLLFQSGSLEET